MKKQVLAFSIAIMQLMVSFSGTKVTAADFNNDNKQADCMDYISLSGSYLIHNQSDNGIWYDNNTISIFTEGSLLRISYSRVASLLVKLLMEI